MNTESSKGPRDQLAATSRLRNVLLGHAKTQRLIFTFILHSQAPESYCLSQSVTTSCCKRHLLHDTLKVWTKMESWNSALCYVPLCQLSPEKGRRQQDTKGYTVLQKSDRRYLPAVYHWVVHWQASCICKLAESWWIGQTNNKKGTTYHRRALKYTGSKLSATTSETDLTKITQPLILNFSSRFHLSKSRD